MFGLSLTRILVAVFVLYISYTSYSVYSIFQLPKCTKPSNCLKPLVSKHTRLSLEVSVSSSKRITSSLTSVLTLTDFDVDQTVEKHVNVSIPRSVRNNGTLYIHSFLYKTGEQQPRTSYLSHDVSAITTFALPQMSTVNLLSKVSGKSSKEEETQPNTNPTTKSQADVSEKTGSNKPVSHWRQRLKLAVMADQQLVLDRYQIPQELYHRIRINGEGKYLPIVYIDELEYRLKDLMPLNASSVEMPLSVSYGPISMGKLRMWTHISLSFSSLHGLGFTEKDTDEMKGIFADTNLYLLSLTFLIAAFHILFDFLAFKNDIGYWKARKTMAGLSTRVVVWRSISTSIIFLYLMDQDTSLLVLIPAGIGTIIEIWKVTKAFKVRIYFSGMLPKLEIGSSTEQEKETEEFDSQAMRYLSYVLYPLCVAGAVYSLIYVQHKSWYSWCINSLVNGVYAFGFLFMMPQLFVNYKLKSVAHLPWRAFMYKAFNTFIDDIFAFIITMPTAHRLACFRDDLIFLVYLYQRWLYPVDKKRANEFGVSYEDEQTEPTAGDAETKKSK